MIHQFVYSLLEKERRDEKRSVKLLDELRLSDGELSQTFCCWITRTCFLLISINDNDIVHHRLSVFLPFKFNDTWCWILTQRGSSWWLNHETAENLHAGNMGSGMLWAECATQTPKQFTKISEWWNKNYKRNKTNEKRKNIKNNFMLYASMIWMHNVCFY